MASTGPASSNRCFTRLPGEIRSVASRSARFIITRGASENSEPSRSGSLTSTAATLGSAAPSGSVSPTSRPSRGNSRGSSQTVPCAGIDPAALPSANGWSAM